MKALSLRQPWAHAVLHLGKRIENRRWGSDFRGPFLIHAAKGCGRQEYADAVEAIRDALGAGIADSVNLVPPLEALPRGGIVGMARVVGCIRPRPASVRDAFAHDRADAALEGLTLTDQDCRWHFADQYGFVLAEVASLTFMPCRGMLGFFDAPDTCTSRAVLAELRGRGAPCP